jgi:hypothetical protein
MGSIRRGLSSLALRPAGRPAIAATWIFLICRFEGRRRDVVLEMDRALWGLRLARDIVFLMPEECERDRKILGTIARYASLEGRLMYTSANDGKQGDGPTLW